MVRMLTPLLRYKHRRSSPYCSTKWQFFHVWYWAYKCCCSVHIWCNSQVSPKAIWGPLHYYWKAEKTFKLFHRNVCLVSPFWKCWSEFFLPFIATSEFNIYRENIDYLCEDACQKSRDQQCALLLQEFNTGIWTIEEYWAKVWELLLGAGDSPHPAKCCAVSPEWESLSSEAWQPLSFFVTAIHHSFF